MTYNILLTMLVIFIVLWVAFGIFAFIRGMQILRGQKVQMSPRLKMNGSVYMPKKLTTEEEEILWEGKE